jgi:hypothetical protein
MQFVVYKKTIHRDLAHKQGCSISSVTTVCLIQNKTCRTFFLTTAVLIVAVTLHMFAVIVLVCSNKHNRCKQTVTHFMLEVTDLLVVGLGDYLASRGKK